MQYDKCTLFFIARGLESRDLEQVICFGANFRAKVELIKTMSDLSRKIHSSGPLIGHHFHWLPG